MTVSGPRRVHDLVVALDYGQFSLCGNPSPEADYMRLLDKAIAGSHIASDIHGVVVLSPHQNNFEMPLRIEEWDHQPPQDDAEWQEVFESSLLVRGGVLRYDTPTLQGATCQVPDGRYAVRISGRGFVSRGWPGSTTPGDEWRVQLWLSAEDIPDRRIQEWHPPDAATDQVR